MSTSTHLPLCVYCGTARSADESRCPHCGRPWIDVRVASVGVPSGDARVPAMVGATATAAGSVVASTQVEDTPEAPTPAVAPPVESTDVAETAQVDTPTDQDTLTDAAAGGTTAAVAAGDTAEQMAGVGAPSEEAQSAEAETDVVPPPPGTGATEDRTTDPSQRFVWLIPALIAGAAVIVVALFAFGVLDDDTTTTVPEAVATPIPTTAAPTTTTQAPTTTAAPTTTTTSTTIPDPGDIEPVGDAIPMSSLTLKAGGIGPLVVGDAAADAVGRLVASLGRPESTGLADEELGLCAGEDGRFVRWAGLTVVVSGTLQEGVFAGYRFEEQAVPTMHLDLATPSGIRVGDPLSALNEVYAAYQIDYVSDGGTNLFRLSDEEGLLLWGPVSSIEETGRVEGINSPDACSP